VISAGAVRVVALVVCVVGIGGMIVTSILNHNGAAVTFGLVTAVAVLCSMVARAVAAEVEQRLSGDRGPASQGPPVSVATDALAEMVERQVQTVVAAGADEAAVRQLVGEAVRLGRALSPRRSVETGSQ
jgi:hypothetical protein